MRGKHTKPERVKPILRWEGGKSRHLKWLLPLITPHKCYVETFGGGLALFCAKERSDVEVINDINGDLVNLYRVLKYHPKELIGELKWMVNSRELLNDFRFDKGITDLQRAARFFLRNQISFGGHGGSFGCNREIRGGSSGDWAGRLNRLNALHARLRIGVAIERLDWPKLVDQYDAADTFFFFDPPYTTKQTSKGYEPWTEKEMERFARRIRKLRGQWVCTVDDSKCTRAAFAGLRMQRVDVNNTLLKGDYAPIGELIVLSKNHTGTFAA